MKNRGIAMFLLTIMMLGTVMAPAAMAKSKEEKLVAHTTKVRTAILRLGVGEETRVSVRLYDKSRLSGYISRANDSSFEVTDLTTGAQTDVPYQDVKQVKGQNLSTGATIAIAAGIAVGVTLLVLYLIARSLD